MPEDVTISKDLGIIEIHSYGHITKEVVVSTIELVKKIGDESGIRAILVDTTEQKSVPRTVDTLNLVQMLPLSTKLAFLISDKQETKNDIYFLETAAFNANVKAKIFYSKMEAIEYIKS
ncbi:MAG: hypothetical protein ACFFDT_00170 [Candidatus Hodarchaeota archaeon]